jgi:hypothetical protein
MELTASSVQFHASVPADAGRTPAYAGKVT